MRYKELFKDKIKKSNDYPMLDGYVKLAFIAAYITNEEEKIHEFQKMIKQKYDALPIINVIEGDDSMDCEIRYCVKENKRMTVIVKKSVLKQLHEKRDEYVRNNRGVNYNPNIQGL